MATGFDRDVVIIGAGIFGLSVAWSCIKRGMSVTIVEKDTVGAGASGGVVGALSPNVPENWSPKKQFQLDSLLSAEAHWTEVDEASGMSSGYGRLGRIIPITNARGLEHAEIRVEDAKSLWDGKASGTLKIPLNLMAGLRRMRPLSALSTKTCQPASTHASPVCRYQKL